MSAVSILPATSALGRTTMGGTSVSQSDMSKSEMGGTIMSLADSLQVVALHHARDKITKYISDVFTARQKSGLDETKLTAAQRSNLHYHDERQFNQQIQKYQREAFEEMLSQIMSTSKASQSSRPSLKTNKVDGKVAGPIVGRPSLNIEHPHLLAPTQSEATNAINTLFGSKISPLATGDFTHDDSITRHQRAQNNVNPYNCPSDAPLTQFGTNNAEQSGIDFRKAWELGETKLPHYWTVSPLKRTLQTLAPMVKAAYEISGEKQKVFVTPLLHEQGGCCGTEFDPRTDWSEFLGDTADVAVMGSEELLARPDIFGRIGERDPLVMDRAEQLVDLNHWIAGEIHARTGDTDIVSSNVTHANIGTDMTEVMTGEPAPMKHAGFANGQRKTYTTEVKNWKPDTLYKRSALGNYIPGTTFNNGGKAFDHLTSGLNSLNRNPELLQALRARMQPRTTDAATAAS